MSRALITISAQADRDRAVKWISQAKPGTRVEFKQAKRSGEQNDKLWATLTDIAAQVPWHGIKLSADDWKFIFLDALKRELRVVPNIDNTGFVNLGRSSSDLSKSEMSDLIELVHAFGAQHDVVFHDQDSNSPEPSPQIPQSEAQVDTPAADEHSPSEAAGTNSEETVSSALPQGWEITYSAALRRAQKKESLSKYASEYWKQYGGWNAHRDGSDGPTAVAIYDVFNNNFGNKEAIDDALRELLP